MKEINYERIIPNHVGPKLAHHGFKYDATESSPPQGHYSFTRSYWGTLQRVSIGPIEYDVETVGTVRSQNDDFPTEVPQSLLLIQEPGFRLWLSNKYLTAVLESEHRSVDLFPNQGILFDAEPPSTTEDFVKRLKADPPPQPGEKLPTWWEFHGEDDLRRVLDQMVQMIVTDGLDWFEEQIVDIRRYHEKLDEKRLAARKSKESG
jgi:hypothetical protein